MVVPLPPSAINLRTEPLWVPAGLMAALVILVSALGAVGGEVVDTGWRSTVAPQAATPSRRVQQFRPAAPATPAPRVSTGRAKVRLVAFDWEQDDSRVVQAQHGSARLRSVVVEENGRRRGFRVAQDDDLLQGFEQPFGADDMPIDEDPGFEEPSFDETLPEPMDDPGFEDTLPPLDDAPMDDAPMDDAPIERDPFDEPTGPAVAPSPSDDEFDDGMEDLPRESFDSPRADDRDAEYSDERQKAMKNCAEELAELKASRITEISLMIAPQGDAGEDYPFECGIDDGTPFADRQWAQVCYMWKASALCHKPLYFENVQLERYGHSWGPCLQPIVSGVHFFARIPAIPYMMGIQAPNECVYTLGHYRPGSCAPYLIEPIPFTWRAAAFQGAAVTGAVFAVP